MPNKTKKQQKQKSTTNAQTPRAEARRTPNQRRKRDPNRALVQRVCGLTDPFCKHAIGAKYPDDSSARTLPWSKHERGTISSSASGEAYRLYQPCYAYAPGTIDTTSSLGTVTAWSNKGATTTFDGVSYYRIVSWGIRLKRISAPLYASGMVHIRTWPSRNGADYSTLNCLLFNGQESLDVPLQDVDDLVIIGTHSDQMPQTFYSIADETAIVANWQARGFLPISLYVSGAPASTAVLSFEYFIHYELMFETSNGMNQLASPPPAPNPLLTGAANIVTSTASSLFARGIDYAGEFITKAATSALLRLTGPGRAASAAYAIMDVD